MFLIFSPYSFLFFSFYLLFLLSLFTIGRFYYFWVVIEILMLLFIGLSYTLFVSSYSQLILYFLIQALSSFILLISYVYCSSVFITISFLLKLSMFPFFMWYLNVAYRFPNFILWVASTLHKLPPMLMIKSFSLPIFGDLLWISILFTLFVRGVIMLSVLDFRIVLVLSSIGNNSWFILSQIARSLVFLRFVFLYSLSLFMVLYQFDSLSKPVSQSSLFSGPYSLSFWLLSLSGMPPFPMFYMKVLVIFTLLTSFGLNYYFFLFLFFNSLLLIGYVQSFMKYFVYCYSSHLNYVIKY